MEGFETVAALAAESKPLDVSIDEQTEEHLAMLSKTILHPSITSSNGSSLSAQNLPRITSSRSTMGSKDFMSTIGEGSMANILDLLSANNSYSNGTSSSDSSSTSSSSKLSDNSVNGRANGTSNLSHEPIVTSIQSVESSSSSSSYHPSSSTSTQIVSTSSSSSSSIGNGQIIIQQDGGDKEKFVDITEFLNLPQTEAARKLGIPTSTLSKRWKEAVNRKWPYRTVAKLDKEIMTLLHNIPQGSDAPPLPPDIEANLGSLLRRRQDELRTVVIRL